MSLSLTSSADIGSVVEPLAFNAASVTAMASAVSGAPAVFLQEANIVTLMTLNAGTGTALLAGGTFVVGSPVAINPATSLVVNGTLDLGGFDKFWSLESWCRHLWGWCRVEGIW